MRITISTPTTDHRGCNFLFIDDRQRRYVISFESCLDVYEKCVNFPQYKKSEYRENGRTMHTLLLEREEDDERGNYGFFILDTPYGKLEGQVSVPKIINNNRYDREEQSNE